MVAVGAEGARSDAQGGDEEEENEEENEGLLGEAPEVFQVRASLCRVCMCVVCGVCVCG